MPLPTNDELVDVFGKRWSEGMSHGDSSTGSLYQVSLAAVRDAILDALIAEAEGLGLGLQRHVIHQTYMGDEHDAEYEGEMADWLRSMKDGV